MNHFSTRKEELKAALAEAEATLHEAVANAPSVEFDPSEAGAKVAKARARCRQLHTALVELNRVELIAAARESIHAGTAPPDDVPRRSVRAARHARRPRLHFFVRSARPSIARQGIGLLTLAMAYLVYFHIDVQLQILSLPSNVYQHTSVSLIHAADRRT